MIKLKDLLLEAEDYRGQHKAPNKTYAPLHDMTQVYPDDIYSIEAPRYYGDNGGDINDMRMINTIRSCRNRPNIMVTIYRAIPNSNFEINAGDWVTLSRNYAVKHGESVLRGGLQTINQKSSCQNIVFGWKFYI